MRRRRAEVREPVLKVAWEKLDADILSDLQAMKALLDEQVDRIGQHLPTILTFFEYRKLCDLLGLVEMKRLLDEGEIQILGKTKDKG
jgi:hypothetical protein